MTNPAPRSRRPVLTGLVLAAAVLMVSAPQARAQSSGEAIRSYDVRLDIQADGSLSVTEVIDYDFADFPHHGIYRDIPVLFRWDQKFNRVYPIHRIHVEGSPGTPDGFKTEHEGAYLRIKIGDPKKTITGRHTYTISYLVQGALNGFPDHDELYWNAIGADWAVPIDAASVRVTAPGDILQVACFEGERGSRDRCATTEKSGSTATFGQGTQSPLPWALGPFEGMTVVVALPTGVVPTPHPILDEKWAIQRAFSLTPWTMAVSWVLLVFILVGLGWLIWRTGRDRRAVGSAVDVAYGTPAAGEGDQPVPLLDHSALAVEYAPPDGVRPGQVGTLIDERANPVDVTATIVDLAVRGYLRIEEIPKRWILGKPDWWLIQLREGDDELLRYERLLFDGLFSDISLDEEEDTDADEADEASEAEESAAPVRPDVAMPAMGPATELARVKLSTLRKHFYLRMAKVQEALYADAVRRKWFVGRPDRVRARWHLGGWLSFLGGLGLMVLLAATTHLGLIGVPFAIGGLVLIWSAHLMPRRTPKGTGLVRRVLGFRTYIETAEKQEARFDEQENLFSKYLPYAIVFGCTEKWARAFAGLADQAASTSSWYVGSRPFSIGSFTSSIDSFTVTSAGTISSTPSGSGSSGFGGGGSSGGGGGGGGGGSW